MESSGSKTCILGKAWMGLACGYALSCLTLSSLGFPLHSTKTDMVGAHISLLHLSRLRPVAGAEILRAKIRSAFDDMGGFVCFSALGVACRPDRTGYFPDIACHVVKSKRICRKLPHWRTAQIAVFCVILHRESAIPIIARRFAVIHRMIAPRGGFALPCCPFPFSLGRQVAAFPSSIGKRVCKSHLHNRIIFAACNRGTRPVGMPPTGPWHESPTWYAARRGHQKHCPARESLLDGNICAVGKTSFRLRHIAGRFHKCCEFAIGYFVSVHAKIRYGNWCSGLFLRVDCVIARDEGAAFYQHIAGFAVATRRQHQHGKNCEAFHRTRIAALGLYLAIVAP